MTAPPSRLSPAAITLKLTAKATKCACLTARRLMPGPTPWPKRRAQQWNNAAAAPAAAAVYTTEARRSYQYGTAASQLCIPNPHAHRTDSGRADGGQVLLGRRAP